MRFYKRFYIMVSELITKYIWLLQTILDAGEDGITFPQIVRRFANRFGEELLRRTFINYKQAVEEVFGIEISCDRRTNRYYVDRGNKMSGSGSKQWLIDSFTVNSLLEKGRESLSGRIEVENIPSGQEHLTGIMDAMLAGHAIEIEYRKYSDDAPSRYNVEPYALKEDKRRWYLYGYCIERQALRCYSLDRVVSMKNAGRDFTMPARFDIRELLATSFGTYAPENGEKGSTIEFRAQGVQARYIEDLPLHHSQSILKKDGEWTYFSIFVNPDSEDLFFELRKYGPRIEIIKPESIRKRLLDDARAVVELYGGTQATN